ncbi:MAG: DNA-3-methyladenine glycosylase II [Cognaticolwellia sp.]|jgi:DNA-3-methyladenine glycosylase II
MIKAINQQLSKDEKLVEIIKNTELPELNSDGDVYSALTRSIVSQQLSTKAAATIYGRFIDLFENRYPDIEVVLSFSIEELRAVGLSRQKASYIQNVAIFFRNKAIVDWSKLSDEEIIEQLIEIKGVGKWTVEMILMFTLERFDVLPLDDLAIRNRMIQLYEVTTTGRALKSDLTKIAEVWRPYRSVACRYLWEWGDLQK